MKVGANPNVFQVPWRILTSLEFNDQMYLLRTHFAGQYRTLQYVQASTLTFLTWDYIITLPDEVRYFWTGRWSYPRCLFLFNRYQALAWILLNSLLFIFPYKSESLCQAWTYPVVELSGASIIFGVQLILACRVYALYHCSKRILIILVFLLATNLAVILFVIFKFSPRSSRFALPWDPNQNTCIRDSPSSMYLALIPTTIFDAIVFILVLIRGIPHWICLRRAGLCKMTIIQTLLRDSTVYFLFVLVIYLSVGIVQYALPSQEAFIVYDYSLALVSISGTQLLISTRQHSFTDTDESAFMGGQCLDSAQFRLVLNVEMFLRLMWLFVECTRPKRCYYVALEVRSGRVNAKSIVLRHSR